MARTYHDGPQFDVPDYHRWTRDDGVWRKRQLSKARRRMWKQGRTYSYIHWSRECNWKAW